MSEESMEKSARFHDYGFLSCGMLVGMEQIRSLDLYLDQISSR